MDKLKKGREAQRRRGKEEKKRKKVKIRREKKRAKEEIDKTLSGFYGVAYIVFSLGLLVRA